MTPAIAVGRAASRAIVTSVSDEADNVVVRLLREMRADMATKGDLGGLKSDLSDLRHDVSEGFASTTTALTAIARQLDP